MPLQAAVQVAGVMLHDSLCFTWHLTLHTVFSVAVQLVLHLLVQSVVVLELQVKEHWPWQAVTQSVLDEAPQLSLLLHSDSHCPLQ